MQRIVQNTFIWQVTIVVKHPVPADNHAAIFFALWGALLQDWQQRLRSLPVEWELSAIIEQGARATELHVVLALRWVACLPANAAYGCAVFQPIAPSTPYSTDFCKDDNCTRR